MMPSARVLVIGGRGFLGRHLLDRARAEGIPVVEARGDLRRLEDARVAVAEGRPAAVVHLASARPSRAGGPTAALADNARMAASVIDAVAELAPEAPVLIPGSAAQYGLGGPEPLAESAPQSPIGAYGAAKLALEAAWLASDRVRVIWARTFNLLGPRQPAGAPVADWALSLARAERGGPRAIRTGPLDRVRDFLDVRDAVDAYMALLSGPARGAVNVCSGRPRGLREIAEALAALASVEVSLEPEPPSAGSALDPRCVVGDPRRLRSMTGWEPARALEESLRDVLADARARTAGEQRERTAAMAART